MIQISLVVIARDEEKDIARCLDSVPFAAEKIVVDSGSLDQTRVIAEKHGARVVNQPFLGFGPQKRLAVSLARYDWILSLDADEALSEDAQNEIKQNLLEVNAQPAAYRLSRLSYYMGRWIHYGGWFPDWQIRLFNKNQANWNENLLHEKVVVTGEIRTIKAPILHWVFEDLFDQVHTNNRYSSIGAEDHFKKKKRFTLFHLIFKPISKFFETYVWKRGFMDGLPGFIIAVGASYSIFLRFAKLWELENIKNKP